MQDEGAKVIFVFHRVPAASHADTLNPHTYTCTHIRSHTQLMKAIANALELNSGLQVITNIFCCMFRASTSNSLN